MKINIQPRESIEGSIVNGSGVLSEIITSDEQRLFKLEEPDIIRAITALNGREPNDVFVRSPTPWGDLTVAIAGGRFTKTRRFSAPNFYNLVQRQRSFRKPNWSITVRWRVNLTSIY